MSQRRWVNSIMPRTTPGAASPFEIGLLYVIGVVQGLALVTFPAASAILVSPTGFALSSTQYGAMFIPQVVLAILASAFGSSLARRLGLRGVLQFGLCGNLASMALLAVSPFLIGSPAAFVTLCLATGALGLGFGATTMTLNTLIQGLSTPARQDFAVLTLNALIGLGTALAPLLITLFSWLGTWWALPVLMSLSLGAMLLATLRAPLDLPVGEASHGASLPGRFWIYAAAVLLYGIAETLSGNWAALYLSTQRNVSAENASYALTAFWIMLTLGRVIFAVLARKLPVTLVFVGLPLLLALAFQLVARAQDASAGIAAFALVGLACSAILPLSLSFAGKEFPAQSAAMLGALIAFYQIGYGIAAFGGGPLVERAGLAYSAVFSLGSLIALALGAVAFLVNRTRAKAPTGSDTAPVPQVRP
ncbi:Predicted arabinose efflux permease, MFS family [Bosea lathyri]|uniref:Predicted arabinose efflux permease, MFS family n=2 Tax=Bosea lathyri TaxID=1036778 RepID=A0A1H6AT44_9HYPH|nr:Predicted arabinose efflux permease, MFS family [Bosea lathyri]